MPGLMQMLQKLKKNDDDCKILVLGLDNAGKTTILRQLGKEDLSQVRPTQGFNMQLLQHGPYTLNCPRPASARPSRAPQKNDRARAAGWDIGGQKSIRAYWRNYYDKTEGLVYVIDSADTQRLQETSIELGQLLADPKLENTPLLVFANKQDLINAAEAEEIVSVLDLKQIRVRPWHIQPCNAREGDGLAEGMEWLVTEVNAME